MNTPRELLSSALQRKRWDRSQFIGALQRAGFVVSRQRVGGWLNEQRGADAVAVPDAGIIGPICDVLSLSPQESADLYAACGYVLPASLRALVEAGTG